MKGPRGRWQYDLRRIWECPQCQKRDFTSGAVVHRACRCGEAAAAPNWMRLVEEDRKSQGPVTQDGSPPGAGEA